jgi:7,8-dihydroneopterin aldolase/epimerase/oxygenase
MRIIALTGIHFFAHIGRTEEEQLLGNEIIVDVEVSLDSNKTDEHIESTVDYQRIFQLVQSVMREHIQLLETTCERIIDHIREEFPHIKSIQVKVTKLNPPLTGSAKQASVSQTWLNKS